MPNSISKTDTTQVLVLDEPNTEHRWRMSPI